MLGWDGSCGRPPQLVVICSKISTFAVSSTTSIFYCNIFNQLWFAQKLVPLRYHQQQGGRSYMSDIVVICSKISTFAVSSTTHRRQPLFEVGLWFAQKLVPLRYHQQLQRYNAFCYPVVICSKISTFAVSSTTALYNGIWWCWLWFAQKLVPLRYHQQRRGKSIPGAAGCDLLKN